MATVSAPCYTLLQCGSALVCIIQMLPSMPGLACIYLSFYLSKLVW